MNTWIADLAGDDVFLEIDGYPGYVINKDGVVKRNSYTKFGRNLSDSPLFTVKEKVIKARYNEYAEVAVCVKGAKTSAKVHRLLAIAFIPNINSYPQVNHIDGNKYNNSLSNLEWCSAKENVKHSYATGLASNKGSRHPRSILKEEDIANIRGFRNEGLSLKAISQKYGVHPTTIGKVTKGVNWGHVL